MASFQEGCTTEGGLLCPGSDASDCSGGLSLTVTPGAFVDDVTGEAVTGRAIANSKVVLDRMEAQAQVAHMLDVMPEELRPLPRAPSLPDMLVSGTPAAELLTQTFTSEQLPHLVRTFD